MSHPTPTRWLAPLALLAAVVAVLVLISGSTGGDSREEPASTTLPAPSKSKSKSKTSTTSRTTTGTTSTTSTQITPAVIEQLKSRALPFELAAGESRSVQVRVR